MRFWQQVRQRISGLCWLSNSIAKFRDIFLPTIRSKFLLLGFQLSHVLEEPSKRISGQRWIRKLLNFGPIFWRGDGSCR
jgi:hypothetical protein